MRSLPYNIRNLSANGRFYSSLGDISLYEMPRPMAKSNQAPSSPLYCNEHLVRAIGDSIPIMIVSVHLFNYAVADLTVGLVQRSA